MTDRDLQLSTLPWLLDHHEAKYLDRRRMVDDLALRPGDAVLDQGCGPGLWTSMFAEKVAPGGTVVGFDISQELIDYAVTHLTGHPLRNSMQFEVGTFEATPFDDAAFDTVFLGNCCCYAADLPVVLKEAKRVSRERVVSKDFDDGAMIFYPVGEHLMARMLEAAARAVTENPPEPPFDTFTARKMHGAFRSVGFQQVTTRPYVVQMTYPLSAAAKRYLIANATWLAATAEPYLSEQERQQWESAFDPVSGVLDREDFYFCMMETLTVGRV
ncbi:methyltransferase domain-containing protein [Candidatus Protofrankia californiensis]|uniref:methyltransferase domain-containing protein n=1 Tax=Candidatus Protofrankia californiensis TaxID=1839754 RepID=UPI0010414CC7|nr:methyltransferase domain-containing protein [Candidatus Protofrankia californiensis]